MFEYEAQMYAYSLREVDKNHDMHIQAWINHQVTGMEKKGNKEVPVYKTFKDFFDYEKHVNDVTMKDDKPQMTDRHKRMAQIAARLNKKGG